MATTSHKRILEKRSNWKATCCGASSPGWTRPAEMPRGRLCESLCGASAMHTSLGVAQQSYTHWQAELIHLPLGGIHRQLSQCRKG